MSVPVTRIKPEITLPKRGVLVASPSPARSAANRCGARLPGTGDIRRRGRPRAARPAADPIARRPMPTARIGEALGIRLCGRRPGRYPRQWRQARLFDCSRYGSESTPVFANSHDQADREVGGLRPRRGVGRRSRRRGVGAWSRGEPGVPTAPGANGTMRVVTTTPPQPAIPRPRVQGPGLGRRTTERRKRARGDFASRIRSLAVGSCSHMPTSSLRVSLGRDWTVRASGAGSSCRGNVAGNGAAVRRLVLQWPGDQVVARADFVRPRGCWGSCAATLRSLQQVQWPDSKKLLEAERQGI